MPLPFFLAALFGKAAIGGAKVVSHHHAKATLAKKLAAKLVDKAKDKAIDTAADKAKAKLQAHNDACKNRT